MWNIFHTLAAHDSDESFNAEDKLEGAVAIVPLNVAAGLTGVRLAKLISSGPITAVIAQLPPLLGLIAMKRPLYPVISKGHVPSEFS